MPDGDCSICAERCCFLRSAPHRYRRRRHGRSLGKRDRQALTASKSSSFRFSWAGFACAGQRSGLYGSALGLAIYSASSVVVLGVLVWLNARKMNIEYAQRSAAQHDFLTGLPNRMLLNDRVNQAIIFAPAPRQEICSPIFGFGRLQTYQRFSGTSDRRQTPSIHRGTAGEVRARHGHGQPPGRR